MKYQTLESLEKHIASAKDIGLSTVYLIVAKDAYERGEALRLFSKLEGDAQRVDGDNCCISELSRDLDVLPFFGAHRRLFLTTTLKPKKALVDVLENYLKGPNPALTLIVALPELRANSSLFKAAEKAGVVLTLSELAPWEKERALPSWVQAYGKKAGKVFSQKVAQAVVLQLGHDKGVLSSELDKLFCFVGERKEIEIKDVKTICSQQESVSTWDLGEAVCLLDGSRALRLGRALMRGGGEIIGILRQLRHQIQVDYQVAELMEASPSLIGERFPYMKGWVLSKHQKNAKTYGVQRFKRAILLIDQAESRLKSQQVDSEVVLDLLLSQLCT